MALWWGVGWLPPSTLPAYDGPTPARRAVWVGVEWAMEPHTDAEVAALADDLRAHGVTDAYFYVSYLRDDDVFNPTYDEAAAFTGRFHTLAPEITAWAWVGVPMQVSPVGPVANRLMDDAVRAQIAAFAARTVETLGYDGLHLNAEMLPNDDADYLATLREIRAALPDRAGLSVAPHALRLAEPVISFPYPVQPHHWTPGYLRAVAGEVDQIAMMTYDSGLFLPADYRRWAAYQVRAVADSLADAEVEVFIGFSVSAEQTPSHHVAAENLTQALFGLSDGLAQANAPGAIDGIALYPYWEVSAEAWRQLDGWPE